MIETRLSIRVGDLQEAIDGTYGSIEAFQESLRSKEGEEPFSEAVADALQQEAHTSDEVMDLRTVWYGDKMPPFGIAQMEVLNEIMQEPPHSIRELAKRMGKNFETVREHVLLLESQGLVWVDRKGRGRRAPVHPVPQEFTVTITRPKKESATSELLEAFNKNRPGGNTQAHPNDAKADAAGGSTVTRVDAGPPERREISKEHPVAEMDDDADPHERRSLYGLEKKS